MRIIAIASAGGHWVQLLRLAPAFTENEIIYISTNPEFEEMVGGAQFYDIPDANRKDKLNMVKSFLKVLKLIFKLKPNVVITTGAAPGLFGILAGKIFGAKTIWVDSIANVEELSMSGKIALKFADIVYTQWPNLESPLINYKGNVL